MTRTLGEWEVDAAEAGSIKVRTPNGPVTVHTTYSDRYPSNSAANRLDSGGMAGTEKPVTQPVVDSKPLFSSEDIAKSEKEAAEEAALIRARGPYLVPEKVHITWFAQKHPAPWMRWVLMTPEIAGYLLREHNAENRNLRPHRVRHYKAIMVKPGKWRRTHQGVAMDSQGQLQDGQHRLAAVVEAANQLDDPNFSVVMPFFVGMDPENFATIDEGLNRSASDTLTSGGIPYSSAINSMIRLIIAFRDDAPRKRIRQKQTNETILSYYKDHDPDDLQAAAKFGSNYAKARHELYCTPGPLAAANYLIQQGNTPDNAYVAAFFSGLVTGHKVGTRVSLDDDDPRRVARRYFAQAKLNYRTLRGIEALSIIVGAWNNMVVGKHPNNIKFTDDSPIPSVIRCDDTGPNRSAVPRALLGEVIPASETQAAAETEAQN